MKLNHVNPRIGDTLLIEPGLTAWAEQANEKVQLYVTPGYEVLFEEHPLIQTVKEPFPLSDVYLCPSIAMRNAINMRLPFACGYFPQLNIQPRFGLRFHYKAFFLKDKEQKEQKTNKIFIAPYARSCRSHQGLPANIEATTDWWEPIIDHLNKSNWRVYTLGDDQDPTLPGTEPFKGHSLRSVVEELAQASLLLTVQTSIVCMASAAKVKTVFLSSATATPVWFASPDTRSEIVRASSPSLWDQNETINKINVLLGEE